MLRRPWPVALLLALVVQALFAWRVTVPHRLVFDEVHYVPAARRLLTLAGPTNIEHPLLAKSLIALGIRLFGDTSLGWRAFATVAGTATVLGIYSLVLAMTGRVRPAVIAAILLAINGLVFVQARIAMLDGFMGAFVAGALASFAWSLRRGGWSRWLAGAALLGCAIGCKWAALPFVGFVGLGLIVVRTLDARRAGRPYAAALTGRDQPHWPGLATIPALAALALVAGAVYLATFWPAFLYHHDPLTWRTLIPFQGQMYAEQTQVLPSHPYQSPWWSWAPMLRPIWYLYEVADGAQRGILLIGNPFVMWGGLIAVVACLLTGWRERAAVPLVAAGLWASSYLMWAIIPKSLGFYYYYYLPSLFLPVAIAVAFDRRRHSRLRGWDESFTILSLGMFGYFYPILAATALAGSASFEHWMWLHSWR